MALIADGQLRMVTIDSISQAHARLLGKHILMPLLSNATTRERLGADVTLRTSLHPPARG